MKTITINILAEDIRTTEYNIPKDCAMTRALKRASISAHEGGGNIFHDNKVGFVKTPLELDIKVQGMYKHLSDNGRWNIDGYEIKAIEPADFSFELEIPDNWVE